MIAREEASASQTIYILWVEDGAYIGTINTMADEADKELNNCESYHIKDVELLGNEYKEERNG